MVLFREVMKITIGRRNLQLNIFLEGLEFSLQSILCKVRDVERMWKNPYWIKLVSNPVPSAWQSTTW
jgi:hypothetical protein